VEKKTNKKAAFRKIAEKGIKGSRSLTERSKAGKSRRSKSKERKPTKIKKSSAITLNFNSSRMVSCLSVKMSLS